MDKHALHRERMRALGYTKVTNWVPVRFKEEHKEETEKIKRKYERALKREITDAK